VNGSPASVKVDSLWHTDAELITESRNSLSTDSTNSSPNNSELRLIVISLVDEIDVASGGDPQAGVESADGAQLSDAVIADSIDDVGGVEMRGGVDVSRYFVNEIWREVSLEFSRDSEVELRDVKVESSRDVADSRDEVELIDGAESNDSTEIGERVELSEVDRVQISKDGLEFWTEIGSEEVSPDELPLSIDAMFLSLAPSTITLLLIAVPSSPPATVRSSFPPSFPHTFPRSPLTISNAILGTRTPGIHWIYGVCAAV